jgi:hypothetical protein
MRSMKIVINEFTLAGEKIIYSPQETPVGKYFNYHLIYSSEWLGTDIVIASC